MEKLKELLRNTQRACVITHRHADLDAYACGVAVSELMTRLGLDVTLVIPEGPSHNVKSFLTRLGINYQGLEDCVDADTIFLVDVSTYAQLNEFRDEVGYKPVVIVDHHEVRNVVPTVSLVDPNATSCSEIIAQVFRELGIEPSSEVATLLIGGVLSDSGRLSRARPETFEVLAWLLRLAGRDYRDIVNAMAEEVTFPERMARVKGLLRLRAYRAGDYIICLSNVNAYESSLADALIKSGCDIALVASEHDGEIRLFGRGSRRVAEKVSLAEVFNDLARYFNGEGGGHAMAAALSVKVRVDLMTILIKALNNIEQRLGVKASRITD